MDENINTVVETSTNDPNNYLSEREISLNIKYDVEVDPFALAKNKDNESHNVITHLLKQVKIGMDLSKVTLPTFILERRSLLEMYAEFFSQTHLFTEIPKIDDELERMKAVLKFYLASFHSGRKGDVPKKPYNPVLGEVFQCIYKGKDRNKSAPVSDSSPCNWSQKCDLQFISEQVSHHPPISAIYAEAEESRICFNCFLWTKSKFLGMSIAVINEGFGSLYLLDRKEEYRITFPNAYGRGILGTPWFELGGNCYVDCITGGYRATIEFHTKPFFGGQRHVVDAKIIQKESSKSVFKVHGKWNDIYYIIEDGQQNEVFLNTHNEPKIIKSTKTIDQQEPYESRKKWKDVTHFLFEGDLHKATEHKSINENIQREEAKAREDTNQVWNPRYFEKDGNAWIYKNPLYKRENIEFEWNKGLAD